MAEEEAAAEVAVGCSRLSTWTSSGRSSDLSASSASKLRDRLTDSLSAWVGHSGSEDKVGKGDVANDGSSSSPSSTPAIWRNIYISKNVPNIITEKQIFNFFFLPSTKKAAPLSSNFMWMSAIESPLTWMST